MPPPAAQVVHFTRYEKAVIAILGFLQFMVVLDFTILAPLGAVLMRDLGVTPSRFGMVVSAYAFSAGISGMLAAGFADQFDRRKLLLFFYGGFVLGTSLCGVVSSYHLLLLARAVTGFFGGVIGAISLAIVADLFPLEARGGVMGFVTTAFAASQVMGLPLGLYLSSTWSWHAPFLLIAAVSAVAGVFIFGTLRPINDHLQRPTDRNPIHHLIGTLLNPRHQWGFLVTMLLALGGYMLMPFSSTFSVNNMGVSLKQLPIIYMVTGIVALCTGPLVGKLSDAAGKYRTFVVGSVLAIAIVLELTHRGITPFAGVLALNVSMFTAISARQVAAQALASAVPAPPDRGAYMAVSSSMQQFAGAVASSVAGLLVSQTSGGPLEHYDRLGYAAALAMAVTIVLMKRIDAMVS